MMNTIEKLGIKLPEILFPGKDIDLSKWSVVACDQYTSQPDYWSQVEETVGENPSTLHMIFPEIYLEEDGKEQRIAKINSTMKKYLDENILLPQRPGFVYIDRKTSHADSRKGLLLTVDLEKYDYNKGSSSLIRATEGTVLDRLPPRIKIRENASIELPHIMLLIDDADKTVIEPLSEKTEKLDKLYDFELMMAGGHICGYKVEDEETISGIISALEKLAEPASFCARYGVGCGTSVLLFAAGDGNHSLATAKAHWENIKKTIDASEQDCHPARFALVEVVNVHDDGLTFEPIHRVVFNIDSKDLIDSMVKFYNSGSSSAACKVFGTKAALDEETAELRKAKDCHVIPFTIKDQFGAVVVKNPKYNLEVGTLQCFLDEYVKNDSNIKIDYIHGEDVVDTLGGKEGNIGFYLPPMDKHDLFKTVILDGVLPRKTFSMGEADEKRFYLECRKIVTD